MFVLRKSGYDNFIAKSVEMHRLSHDRVALKIRSDSCKLVFLGIGFLLLVLDIVSSSLLLLFNIMGFVLNHFLL